MWSGRGCKLKHNCLSNKMLLELSFQIDCGHWFYFCISLPLFPGEMFKFYDFKMNFVYLDLWILYAPFYKRDK